jgi:hypothetical protein
LLHTIQETEEEAGRPRQHGASSEAPRELVLHLVNTRAHRELEVMTAAGHNTRPTCTRMRAMMRRRWRPVDLDHMESLVSSK